MNGKLCLEQHVKVTDWIANNLVPPIYRIYSGRTIPVRNIESNNNRLTAEINLDEYNITSELLQGNCTIDEGSFIRLSPCYENPYQGQTIAQLLRGGSTCFVEVIDWNSGKIELEVRQTKTPGIYQLPGRFFRDGEDIYDYATLDESPSDFVAGRVDEKLQNTQGNHVCQWLAPENPQIPPQISPSKNDLEKYQNFLNS
ncbi:hypothetical protein [Okeania sp. SIO2B9]|uniref:hypothetical protein n=1 Tax=Okeania sp. SIO2B9 TaxID=2607782 RepID=UPI00142A2DC9|nr:hypothetical protein [Okeania sp. SIO2B9]NES89883.1 hypothetical protein [Okeania sp. SIO2B9]